MHCCCHVKRNGFRYRPFCYGFISCGIIRLGARCEGKHLVLFVEGGTAAGPGPVNADRQLEPDGGASHGTGLRLVAQIPAAHGGTVQFEQGVDKGLCVSVVLPIR